MHSPDCIRSCFGGSGLSVIHKPSLKGNIRGITRTTDVHPVVKLFNVEPEGRFYGSVWRRITRSASSGSSAVSAHAERFLINKEKLTFIAKKWPRDRGRANYSLIKFLPAVIHPGALKELRWPRGKR